MFLALALFGIEMRHRPTAVEFPGRDARRRDGSAERAHGCVARAPRRGRFREGLGDGKPPRPARALKTMRDSGMITTEDDESANAALVRR
ncbi:MAG: hypothetical protein ACLP01_02825 [Solirubrobacteraceae bacterium]